MPDVGQPTETTVETIAQRRKGIDECGLAVQPKTPKRHPGHLAGVHVEVHAGEAPHPNGKSADDEAAWRARARQRGD